MKSSPRLRLEPGPSPIACALLVTGCTATSILVALLPLPVPATVLCAATIVAALASGVWHCTRRGVPALLYVGIDRRIAVSDRGGRTRNGSILDDSYVGAALTTIVWQADGEPWWRPARTILILPDSLPADDFRQLRAMLRYGRPARRGDTSGLDEG